MSEYNNLNGEILDNAVINPEQLGNYQNSFVLLPPGDYDYTVVNIEQSRYTPGPEAKIGACKQVTLTLRVKSPDGKDVDLKHNLFMWGTTVGMIAQYQDSIGIHKSGEQLRFDWRPEVHIGKTGRLKLDNKPYVNRRTGQELPTNNIVRLYPKDAGSQPAQQSWKQGW